MKNYKIKAEYLFQQYENGASVDILYECDAERNTECAKTNCGECKHTSEIRFAKRFDLDG